MLEFNYLSWWVGGSEKNEINAILNSIEVKVEVGVELGKNIKIFKVDTKSQIYYIS